MKRNLWIQALLLLATTAAWLVARVSGRDTPQAIEAQQRTPSSHLREVRFLDDTLLLQLHPSLLLRLPQADAKYYNALHNKQLRSSFRQLCEQLDRYCTSHRTCDWGRYLLVRSVSEAAFPDTQSNERIALQIFLLEQMGFDARAAISGEWLVMLLPFDATVYERGYIVIDSTRFYIFEYTSSSDGYLPIARTDTTQRRPLSIEIGIGIDSRPTTPITLPLWSNYLGTQLTLPISLARIELMRQYPTTEKAPFHRAEIPAPLAESLLPLLAQRTAEMSQLAAAEYLLGLVQHCFEFTSDSDLFGRHKQMTIEESFYYGRNNCKDRTLVYSWLISELLGLRTVLIDYQVDPHVEPIGHVACGVEFTTPVGGTSITYRGRTYTLCDPSYIDAPVGQAMPRYARWPMVVAEF